MTIVWGILGGTVGILLGVAILLLLGWLASRP
jgi:hypothetical protein